MSGSERWGRGILACLVPVVAVCPEIVLATDTPHASSAEPLSAWETRLDVAATLHAKNNATGRRNRSPEPGTPSGPMPWLSPPEVATSVAIGAQTKSAAELAVAVRHEVLANGLTVFISEDRSRPEVFGAVVVRTGARNDPADNTGLAHYLEHMLFKGTTTLGTTDWSAEQPIQARIERLYDQIGATTDANRLGALEQEIAATVQQSYAYVVPNEVDKLLAETGGVRINAFTSEDETVYHNAFAASRIDAWLELTAHRFVEPVFRLFPSELEAVYEEKNITMDRFEVQLFERLVERAFPQHPYGTQSVIGSVEHLKRPSLRAMREYFDRYYVASNMALVLAGDVDADEVMPLVRERFGVWPRGETPPQRSGAIAAFDGEQRLSLRLTPVRVGGVAYRTVAPNHPDHIVLRVIRAMLHDSRGTGCLDTLVRDGKLLLVYPFEQGYADTGLDVLFFVPRLVAQTFRRAEALVRGCVEDLGRGDFEEKRMLAVRDRLVRIDRRNWESNDERALEIARAFVREPSWQYHVDAHARLANVTRDDVMRVAATYFGEARLSMRSRMGRPKKQRLRKPAIPPVTPTPGAHSAFYEQMRRSPRPASALQFIDPQQAVATLAVAPGVTLRSNHNPYDDAFALQLRFGLGTSAEPALDVAAELLPKMGVGARGPEAVERELVQLGLNLDCRATADRFVVTIEGPAGALPAALALVDGLVHTPVPDKARLRRLRRERLALARVQRRNPAHLANALAQYMLYGKNSRYLREVGPRGLRRLNVDDVLVAWQRAAGHEVEVRYVGRRAPSEVVALVREHMHFASAPKPAVPYVIYPRVLANDPTVYFLADRRAIQSHLRFAIEGEAVPVQQRAAADAFDEYLGGSMAGLVFQEIREFRALAYSAHAQFRRDPTPEQRSYLLADIGCQADKTHEAWHTMMSLLTDMPRHPDRIESIRDMLTYGLETRSPDYRSLQSTLESWRRRGYASDPRRELAQRYRTMAFADIEAIYRQHVDGRPITAAIVGDRERVDLEQLAAGATIIEVEPSDIFAR